MCRKKFKLSFLLLCMICLACSCFVAACGKQPDAAEAEVSKTGTVTGEVTWLYNNFIGNKPDKGAPVILISTKVKSLPDRLGYGISLENLDLPEGVYTTTVTGTGNYTFDNVPIGDYYLVIISNNTNEKTDQVTGSGSWGEAYALFSEQGQEYALTTAKLHKTRSTKIKVSDGETTNYSYDFGMTYFSY